MRVGIDTSILNRPQAGSATYVRELTRGLEASSDTLELVRFRGPVPRKGSSSGASKVRNFLAELTWLHLVLPVRAYRARISVLHMPTNVSPILAPCPVVTTIHDANIRRVPDSYDPWYRRYATLAFLLSAKRSKGLITGSRFSANDVRRYFRAPPSRVSVVPYGVSPPSQTAGGAQPLPRPYVLFVGQTEPHKNLGRLVEAFCAVRGHPSVVDRDVHLCIAGPAGRDHVRLRKQIDVADLGAVVHLLGPLSQDDLNSLYVGAAAFAFPSLNEGFGFPPLEAMARDVPVMVSTAGSLPEIVGDAGFYCDPCDIESIARGLVAILSDEEIRSALVAKGHKRVEQFTWERCCRLTTRVYRSVIS